MLVGEEKPPKQIVLDPALESAADAKGLELSELRKEGERLLKLAVDEGRLIVAYAQYELEVFRDHADLDLSEYYRDAKKIAKDWKKQCHRDKPKPTDGYGLKYFLKFISYPRPALLGNQKTAPRIRYVRKMLQDKGDYDSLTDRAKIKWQLVLTHNRIDCEGMQQLTLRAALELSAGKCPQRGSGRE